MSWPLKSSRNKAQHIVSAFWTLVSTPSWCAEIIPPTSPQAPWGSICSRPFSGKGSEAQHPAHGGGWYIEKGIPGGPAVNSLPAMQRRWIWSLGQEDPLEKEIATHSNILAWEIPWTKEYGRPQSMGSQRIGHHLVTTTSIYNENSIKE